MSDVKLSNKKKPASKKEITHGFSIIIANYNYEGYVGQAIQSGLNQDYPDAYFEVIVVDDGSTDNSRQVIAEITAKNDNLRVITQTNLGQAAAFYAGVNAAKYEWICLLDSDDYFKPEKLSVLNTFINKQQANFDFICHNVDAVDELNKTHQDWFLRQNISGEYLSVDDAKGGYPYANPCGQVYRKSLLQKIAPWLNLSEWQRGADNPLAWASLFMNGRVCYLHQSLAVYRIHANNFFMASTPNGLVPKVNWLERWPKLIAFLNYLHQANASSYISNEDRDALLARLEKFFKFWEKNLTLKPGVPYVSFITTCKNRLHHLKQTLPRMVKQSNAEVIVVDYGCTQGTRDWVKTNYPQVKVVAVDDDDGWSAARARNMGAAQAKADWLCFIDADVLLKNDLSLWIQRNTRNGSYYLVEPLKNFNLAGTVICEKSAFLESGRYDEACRGWFPEDSIFYDDMKKKGYKESGFPQEFLEAIEHGDEERVLGNGDKFDDKRHILRTGLIYKIIRNDLADLAHTLNLEERARLIVLLREKLNEFEIKRSLAGAKLVIDVNKSLSMHESINFDRKLIYTIKRNDYISRYEMKHLVKNKQK